MEEDQFTYKEAINFTVADINHKKGFNLSKEELYHYWLRYPKEFEEKYRNHISWKIFTLTGSKVYWIDGKEVRVVLYDEKNYDEKDVSSSGHI